MFLPRLPVNHQDQGEAVDDLADVRGDGRGHSHEAEGFRQQHQEGGGQEDLPEVPHPADDDDAEDEDGLVQGETGRVDIGDVMGIEDTGDGSQHSADDERDDLRLRHILPQAAGVHFVLAQRLQDAPERRFHQATQDDPDQCGEERGKQQEGPFALDGDAEEGERRNARDAQRAVRDALPIVHHGEHHHLNAQRDDDEIVVHRLDCHPGHNIGHQPRKQQGQQHIQQGRRPEIDRHQRGRVGADSVEPSVGQRNLPAIPRHETQRLRENRVDADQDQKMEQVFHTLNLRLFKFLPAEPVRPEIQENYQDDIRRRVHPFAVEEVGNQDLGGGK